MDKNKDSLDLSNKQQALVLMYTKEFCPFCAAAEQLLRSHGVRDIVMKYVDKDSEALSEMRQRTNEARTVPQIFIGNKKIGGYDELSKVPKDSLLALLFNDTD